MERTGKKRELHILKKRMKRVIALLGPPGAGKDTQCNLISKRYKTKTVSPGNILRKEIKKKTKLGKKIKEMMRNGDLVPDHIIKSIIDKEIKKSKSPVVLDGSPRDLAQAKVLKDVSMVLFLRCTKKEAVKRLLKRAKTENRPDDTKEVIEHRWNVYKKETKPLMSFYKKKKMLKEVNANPSIQKVFRQITPIIEEVLNEK